MNATEIEQMKETGTRGEKIEREMTLSRIEVDIMREKIGVDMMKGTETEKGEWMTGIDRTEDTIIEIQITEGTAEMIGNVAADMIEEMVLIKTTEMSKLKFLKL